MTIYDFKLDSPDHVSYQIDDKIIEPSNIGTGKFIVIQNGDKTTFLCTNQDGKHNIPSLLFPSFAEIFFDFINKNHKEFKTDNADIIIYDPRQEKKPFCLIADDLTNTIKSVGTFEDFKIKTGYSGNDVKFFDDLIS